MFIYSKMAVHFGPDKFGVWNYFLSFASLVPALSSLGLNFIIVKYIGNRKTETDNILFNCFIIRVFSSIVSCVLIYILYFFSGVNNSDGLSLVFVFMLMTQIILVSNILIQKNEAFLENKKTVIPRNAIIFLFSIVKLIAIKYDYGLVSFSIILMVENLILVFWMFFKDYKFLVNGRLDKRLIWELLNEGFPLLLAAITTTLYLKIDQIFLGWLSSNQQLGIYSSSAKLSEYLYAIPAIITSVYLSKLVNNDEIKHSRTILQNMYLSSIYLSLLICIIVYFSSDLLVNMMYGIDYLESGDILKIHIWSLFFMSFLVSSSKELIFMNKENLIFKRELLALIFNIVLNLILIPKFDAVGAAIATLISYSVSAIFSNFLFKETRHLMKNQVKSLILLKRITN